ncbi:MAG: hypothetical protein JWM34_1855 [Ilumatobacteraceae bacterium]|nr:hypothetical protein [Ilumatobacteraceae bacterium]
MDPRRLEDAVDHVELRRVQDAYADIVSRRNWPELWEVFLPTVTVDLDLRDRVLRLEGPDAVGEFIGTSIEVFEFFQFNVRNTRIHLRAGGNPDRAAARMYMNELRQTHSGHWSQVYGVYHDTFHRVDGRWWIATRQYHSLARNNMPAAIFDFPHEIDLDTL